MNLLRQRDDLKLACSRDIIKKWQLEMALASPVFQWWSGKHELSDDEWEFLSHQIMETTTVQGIDDKPTVEVLWPRAAPYECFRISYMDIPVFEQWFIGDKKMVCLRCDDEYSHEKVHVHSLHSNNRGEAWYRLWMWVNGKRLDLNVEFTKERREYRAGKIGMITNEGEMSDFASSVTQMLCFFLFDIYVAGHCVIKVSPKPDSTKSVQWRKAREHYLVLRRQHVEKLMQTKGSVSDEDIVRAAHWRRKHLRRLSSGKFVNKRGLLVPVKKAWVGPTEWMGNDGKVYTVVGMEPPPLT
jgi:hypothetical protein